MCQGGRCPLWIPLPRATLFPFGYPMPTGMLSPLLDDPEPKGGRCPPLEISRIFCVREYPNCKITVGIPRLENKKGQNLIPRIGVSVKPSPAKTNRQAPTSLPVCLIIIIVFFGKIHPFPKCSLAFSVALVQQQIAVWIINLFRLLPLLEKCGFYNLKYPTVEIFARCGTICFYAVQDKISKEIFLVHRITVF